MSKKNLKNLEELVSIDFDAEIEELNYNDNLDVSKDDDSEEELNEIEEEDVSAINSKNKSNKITGTKTSNKSKTKFKGLKSDNEDEEDFKSINDEDNNEDENEDEDVDKDEDNEDEEELDYGEDIDKKQNSKSNHSISKKEKSPALIFAKFLKEKGVVTLDETELEKINELVSNGEEEEAFEYLFSSEVNKRVEEIKNTYDDDIQEYLLLRDYGVSPEKAMTLVKNKNIIEQISEDDIEDENNTLLRKDIIKSYLKLTTKMDDDDITEYIETLVDSGKDILWARKGLVAIKEHNNKLIEEEKQRIKQEEEELNNRIKEAKELIKKTVMETDEILGNRVTTATKNKIINMLIEPAGKDSAGNPIDGIIAWLLKDPIKNRINLAYAITSGILDGKLTNIKKKVKTEVLQELESSIFEKNNLLGGNTKISNSSDGIKVLKEIFGDE